MDADVIVVGAGLAGLVATHELTSRGQEGRRCSTRRTAANLGGQAFWSFGGLFLVDSPEQRRLGVKDSFELAWNDWRGSAPVRPARRRGRWAVRWARAYVEFAAGEKRSGCPGTASSSCRPSAGPSAATCVPTGTAIRCPASTSPGAPAPGWSSRSSTSALAAAERGLVTFHHRHRVDELVVSGGAVTGVRGTVLAPDDVAARRAVQPGRRRASSSSAPRPSSSPPAVSAATTTSCGGTGRSGWAPRPASMITGVPAYVDGRMLDIAADAGVRLVNRDRMWHYTEGVQNWDPIWPGHAIRILPGPSSMWFDALGRRLPAPVPARLRHPAAPCATCAPPRTSRTTTTAGSS